MDIRRLRKPGRTPYRAAAFPEGQDSPTFEDIIVSTDHQSLVNQYFVVLNSEEQYSIWPSTQALPAGWFEVGKRGSREACLEYINQVWVDMRPRSLREMCSPVDAGLSDVAKA